MKYYNISIICIICVLFLNCAFDSEGQIRINSSFQKSLSSPKVKSRKKVIPNAISTDKDTLYAISTKKQNGWLAPLQTVDKKDIGKYPNLYRFSNKNSAGNWCRVESVDGNGSFIAGKFSTYIVKSNERKDSLANDDWKRKIDKTCRLDLISDPLGERVIQERAYDSYGDLIFSFSISPLGTEKNIFVGSYRDTYGLPAEMRNDKDFAYGTLVYIERDKWGNDSIVRYMDSKGYGKPNSDGVFCEQFIYDEFGRLLRDQSMDSNGMLVNDNMGYCGVEYQYDNRHNIIRATYMDDDWKPVKVKNCLDVIRKIYKYDEFNRLIELQYVDEFDCPIGNSKGTHKEIYEYNDFARRIMICGLDVSGNLSPYGTETDRCKSIDHYDENGDILRSTDYDCNGNIIRDFYIHSYLSSYDEDNSAIPFHYDQNDNVKIRKVYKNTYNTYKSTTYLDDGRISNITYYDSEGNIDKNESIPIIEYQYDVSREERPFNNQFLSDLVDIEIYKDAEGIIRQINCCNKDNSYVIDAKYENGYLIEISGKGYKNNENLQVDDLNEFGKVTRCGGSSWMHGYSLRANKTPTGNYNCYYGTDEFGEPNYSEYDDGTIYCYMHKSKIKDNLYLDENNVPITDFKAFKDNCPKYLSIEVTDKIGYEYGFDDNDIVLAINDYCINPLIGNIDFIILKSLLPVLTAGDKKNIKLFHIDPVTLTTSVKNINIDVGSIDEYGFRLHCMYATSRQHERISKMAHQNMETLYYDMINSSHNNIVGISRSSFRDKSPYSVQNGKDAILLGAQIKDFPLINWKYGEDQNKIEKIINLRNNVTDYVDSIPEIVLYVTHDGIRVDTIKTKENKVGCSFFHANVDNDTYLKMRELSKSISWKSQSDHLSSIKDYKNLDDEAKDWLYNRAEVYYQADFEDLSFDIYKKLADVGYAKAYSKLNGCYSYGWGTQQNLKKAEKYAVLGGDEGLSLCRIADKYLNTNKKDKAISLLKKVGPEHYFYDWAQMYLGDAYLTNDTTMALDCYFTALNDCESLAKGFQTKNLINRIRNVDSNVSMMDSIFAVAKKIYSNREYKKSYSIFEALVDYDYDPATLYLSHCLLYGQGTEKDEDMAISLAEQQYYDRKDSDPLYNVGIYFMKNEEFNKAIKIFKKIEKGSSFMTRYNMGKIYANPKFYYNNLNETTKYWVNALSNNNLYNNYKDKLLEIEEFLLSCDVPSQEVIKGLFYLAWEYLDNDVNEKGLSLLQKVYELDPDYSSKHSLFNQKYYIAMHANGIPSVDEYRIFMDNKCMKLYVPDDLQEDHDLYKYKGQKLPIASLNGWNNMPENLMINIFDHIADENVITVEIDSKLVEISTSQLRSSYIHIDQLK